MAGVGLPARREVEMQGQLNLRACAAELVGTFLFFAIGFTAVQATGALQAPVLLVVPFAFGFGLLAAIAAFGPVSGGHFNPAVTVAMVLDGRTTLIDAVGYIVAQVLGGAGSALLVLVLFNQDAVKGVITSPGHGFSDVQALILETVLTAVFILVILASSKKAPKLAGIVIPLDPGGHPLRGRALQRGLGEPGPIDRPGPPGRRPGVAVDLPRGPDRRRGHRLGGVGPGGAGRTARLTSARPGRAPWRGSDAPAPGGTGRGRR